jgi:hypothetical protein
MMASKFIPVFILAGGLVSCGEPSAQPTEEITSVTTLIVSKKNGATERVGTLTFENGGEPALNVETTGPDGEALRKAWDETSAIDPLPMEETRPGETNGKTVTTFGTTLVPRDNEDYKWAVYDYLERKYGYQVDVQK